MINSIVIGGLLKSILGTHILENALYMFTPHNKEQGFLVLIRLVESPYFRKHLKHLEQLKYTKSPSTYTTPLQTEERHRLWLNKIREVVGPQRGEIVFATQAIIMLD